MSTTKSEKSIARALQSRYEIPYMKSLEIAKTALSVTDRVVFGGSDDEDRMWGFKHYGEPFASYPILAQSPRWGIVHYDMEQAYRGFSLDSDTIITAQPFRDDEQVHDLADPMSWTSIHVFIQGPEEIDPNSDEDQDDQLIITELVTNTYEERVEEIAKILNRVVPGYVA